MAGNQEERSASSPWGIVQGMVDLLSSLLECPVCFGHILPPIFQCPNGHLVCDACRKKITSCPTCKGSAPTIRSLAMEKIAANLKFPCKNHGCPELNNYKEKVEHEKSCKNKPVKCWIVSPCYWQGPSSEIEKHIKEWHNIRWRFLSFLGHEFVFAVQIQEKIEDIKEYFAILKISGSQLDAQKMEYSLELKGNGRSITWKAMPWAKLGSIGSSIVERDCLIFDTCTVQLLTDGGRLRRLPSFITVTITEKSNPTKNISVQFPLFDLLG